jgi:Icc protein
LFADSDSNLRGTVTLQSLRRVLQHIRASNWPADIVSVTGDLIQDDTAEAYRRFCAELKTLRLPVYCVPGNHDIREMMLHELQQERFHYCDTVRLGPWMIIGIDSCKHDSAAGEVDAAEMTRLCSTLDDASAEHILICLHHPPLPVGSRWLDQVGLQNADAFLERVSAYGNVRGIIFGHVHQEFDDVRGNVRIIGTPSTCRQFKPDSDEFAVDDQPPAYRQLTLNPDGTIDAKLFWMND